MTNKNYKHFTTKQKIDYFILIYRLKRKQTIMQDDKNKVLKFGEFETNENSYSVGEDGTLEKQDWELYEDHYSNKYVEYVSSDEKKELFEGDKVWVLKHMDKKVAVFSTELDGDKLKQAVEILKN